jgi:hypothetical protein
MGPAKRGTVLRPVRVSSELMQAENVVRLLRIICVSGPSISCGWMSYGRSPLPGEHLARRVLVGTFAVWKP